mgnify:CR=1 FL=1
MTLEELNKMCQGTFISQIEIEFTDFGDTYMKARMPVNNKTKQPMGSLHGGASLALAESVAGAGSMAIIDTKKYIAYGFQVSGNHLTPVHSGEVWANAQLTHKGNSVHIWDVQITDKNGTLISIVRVSNMIKEK